MIIGLIPSRLNSTRLHQKPLIEIDGLPIVVHTMKRAKLSKMLDKVVVCTDSQKVFDVVFNYGGEAILTSPDHQNGTERIAEASKNFKEAELFVDVQGDEPLVNPEDIDKVISFHKSNSSFDIVVPSHPVLKADTKYSVKLVSSKSGKVLYFSRSEIPFTYNKRPEFYSKHLSIVSFKPESLLKFAELPQSNLELIEGIELLRAIENDMNVGTFVIEGNSFAVDVKEDLIKAVEILPDDKFRKLY